MSRVFIKNHNERVEDLVREEVDEIYHPARYVSKYSKYVKTKIPYIQDIGDNKKLIVTSAVLALNKTMGYAHVPLRNPCNFLRKNEGIKFLKKKLHVCGDFPKSDPVPRRSEIQPKIPKPTKNAINIYVDKMKNTKPIRPKPKYADSKNGTTHALCKAGLLPAYVFSPNFGKIPKYLLNVMKTTEKQKQIDEVKKLDDGEEIKDATLMTLDERDQLLVGLKKNWLELHKTFQALPVFTDTIPKKLRKNQLEIELRHLEHDILLIENNPQIYICNTPSSE